MPNPPGWIEKRLFDKPWIALEGTRRMDQYIMAHHRVFEWGAGSSTIWLAERCGHVVSVESDEGWYELIVAEAERRDLLEKLDLVLTDPKSELYSTAIDLYSYLGPFDLIFIDGKAGTRTACAKRAVRYMSDRGLIVLDNSGAADSAGANRVLAADGWIADRHVGAVYDPRRPEAEWGMTEIAFWTKPA